MGDESLMTFPRFLGIPPLASTSSEGPRTVRVHSGLEQLMTEHCTGAPPKAAAFCESKLIDKPD
jgi:hypothetical protein